MNAAAIISASMSLFMSVNAQYTSSSGSMNWTQDGRPYGVSESDMRDALANPIASHDYTTGGLLNITGNSSISMPDIFTTSITVVELPVNKNGSEIPSQAGADLIISTSKNRDVDTTGWEVCNVVFFPNDLEAFSDLFSSSSNDAGCAPFTTDCIVQLLSSTCDDHTWPSECPGGSISSIAWNETATSLLGSDAWLNYYSSPYDASNKTEANKLANAVIPIIQMWTSPDKLKSSAEVHCLRAAEPSSTPTSTVTPVPTSNTSTTQSSSFAGPTAVLQKEYLLGAAMAAAGSSSSVGRSLPN
ncbi:hypothetical protein G7054_g13512 [Neopestalotiopsis clavispora]|nr:hypothetical protein G7054_g13512 [Neopestalotiopsis clavispora]